MYNTKELIINHYNSYPLLQIQDILKFLHQSTFGCEHAVSSTEQIIERINSETANLNTLNNELIEPLDGEYSRVSLSFLQYGLSANTLGKLFFLSAKDNNSNVNLLETKLNAVKELICEGKLPFMYDEFNKEVTKWKNEGYCALHHSEQFRSEYKPAYRVISNRYIQFIKLFAKLDSMLEKGNVKLAIEGRSASGKTTLSKTLEQLYDCNTFHTDDFFLRPEQRTAARLAEIGGNFDRERFSEEIVAPLWAGEKVVYRPYDCSTKRLIDAITVFPKKLSVIEGVYSTHPYLNKSYDLSVFLDIDRVSQKKRIMKRNTETLAERFFNEWIPMENRYFEHFNIPNKCDIIISAT